MGGEGKKAFQVDRVSWTWFRFHERKKGKKEIREEKKRGEGKEGKFLFVQKADSMNRYDIIYYIIFRSPLLDLFPFRSDLRARDTINTYRSSARINYIFTNSNV